MAESEWLKSTVKRTGIVYLVATDKLEEECRQVEISELGLRRLSEVRVEAVLRVIDSNQQR